MSLYSTENQQYDVISVLYHLLKGAQTTGKYVQDAERAGDGELAQYFKDVQEQYNILADRGRVLLSKKVS